MSKARPPRDPSEAGGLGNGAAREADIAQAAGAMCGDAGISTEPTAPALRAAMDAWIERHLHDPDPSPVALAAAHAVSVRTVYRLYSQSRETFGTLVRRRRLEHARLDLSTSYDAIADIAARWGFADSSHLSRSFKSAFGVSPRDYRAART